MTTPSRDELPLPDYDHIPNGTLASRLSPLDEAGVQQLLDYERAHGDRLPVTVILEARLEQLRNGAEPSGSLDADMPEVADGSSGSSVSPATARGSVPPPAKSSPMLPDQPA